MATGDDSSRARAFLARGLALQQELRSWQGPGSARLLKLVRGELAFVNLLAGLPSLPPSCPELRSSNFDHLEAVLSILKNPLISGVSAVMQSFAVTMSEDSTERDLYLENEGPGGPVAHVDIVCMLHGQPIWLVVSKRNPRYVMWNDSGKHGKGLRSRLILLLRAACVDAVTQPASILLCFSGDVDDEVDRRLRDEFGAVRGSSLRDDRGAQVLLCGSLLESSMVVLNPNDIHEQDDCNFSEVEGGEWLDIEVNNETPGAAITPSPSWVTYDVGVPTFKEGCRRRTEMEKSSCELRANPAVDVLEEAVEEGDRLVSSFNETLTPLDPQNAGESESDEFYHSSRSIHDDFDSGDHTLCQGTAVNHGLINLDTTCLVALVSEVSNGGAERLLSLAHEDLVKRFSSMTTFIREQALSELDRPLVEEIEEVIASSQPIVSQYVHDEFTSIVAIVGGPKERKRARKLLQRVRVVPNTPSERVMALPCTGKIKNRHKFVFGTGDKLNVPTLTANMAFIRAATQKGMAIAVVEHRPRALTGD